MGNYSFLFRTVFRAVSRWIPVCRELGALKSCACLIEARSFPSMKWRHCVQEPHEGRGRGGVLGGFARLRED